MQKILDLDDELDHEMEERLPKKSLSEEKLSEALEKAIVDTKKRISAAFGQKSKTAVRSKLTLPA